MFRYYFKENLLISYGTSHEVFLIDTDAKIECVKNDAGYFYRNKLTGTFTILRSENVSVYDDMIQDRGMCEPSIIIECKKSDGTFIADAEFDVTDIEFDSDRCTAKITARDRNNYAIFDKLSQMDFNVLSAGIPAETLIMQYYTDDPQYVVPTETTRTLTRGLQLNGVIDYLVTKCGLAGWDSTFFKSSQDPIGFYNLQYLYIIQYSDAKFELVKQSPWTKVERKDPATVYNLKLQDVLDSLHTMFNVYWYIGDDNRLKVEHWNYFYNNLSYSKDESMPGVDLLNNYYFAVDGMNKYKFKEKPSLRRILKSAKSFSAIGQLDGVILDNTLCSNSGSVDESQIIWITEINPVAWDNDKDDSGGILMYAPQSTVVTEGGAGTGNYAINWFNLMRYHCYGQLVDDIRYYTLDMQGGYELTPYNIDYKFKKNKLQKELSFPSCFTDFDPNKQIRTEMGWGKVDTASFNLKTSNINVELLY